MNHVSELFLMVTLGKFRINYTIGSKFLNLREVLFQEIMLCMFGRDIDRQKFCKYVWDYLFRKSSIVKGCGGENLVVNNSDRNKLVAEVYKSLREQRNKLMLGLALNGLGSAYSLPL